MFEKHFKKSHFTTISQNSFWIIYMHSTTTEIVTIFGAKMQRFEELPIQIRILHRRRSAYCNCKKILKNGAKKYVGVQSWKAAHLPTLEIRVEQKGNRVYKTILFSKKLEKNCHFFYWFRDFFPIEILRFKRGLRMQSFISVGQTIPEVLGERHIL